MSSSLQSAARSEEVNSLDSIRLRPAKASLPVKDSQCDVRGLIAETIRVTSSQKAAATDMQIDPAQLTRQLQTGHLTIERIEALGPVFAAKLGERLVQEYAPLVDPKAEARRALREIEARVDTLRQFIEDVA